MVDFSRVNSVQCISNIDRFEMPNGVKAFELVSCIEDVRLEGDRQSTTIHCLEYSDGNLYLGTSDSFILWYEVEESTRDGICSLKCSKQGFCNLGIKKPIVILKAASALDRMLSLCDGVIFILSLSLMQPVPGFSKLKGITCMCVNDNPLNGDPFAIQVCVATKKQLHVFNINQDQAVHVKKQSLPEPAVTLAMDGRFICAALTTQYAIINWESGFVQHLMPYDIVETSPLVKRISRDEFLLGGPNALGIFVTTEGTSERTPLSWSETVHAATYVHPYLITMDRESITVYSILDQKPKQKLQFYSGACLDNLCGRVFLSSALSVYALTAVHWEKQVQDLLSAKRVSEALHLAQNANHVGIPREQFLKIFGRLQQQAGFIELSQFHFEEAEHLFLEGHLDARELIALFPNLLLASNTVRSLPPLHEITNINHMCGQDEKLIKDCKSFLLQFLENFRANVSHGNGNMLQDVNTVLLKLYAEANLPELVTAAMSYGTNCHAKEVVEWFSGFARYHALALLHYHRDETELALRLWVKLVKGEISDDSFPGLSFLVEVLSNVKDLVLVWNYAPFVLEQDQELGVKIYINRPRNEIIDNANAQVIADNLQRFPVAMFLFMEYLVFNCNVKVEKYHTHLAILYVNNIKRSLDSDPNSSHVTTLRKKFQYFLLESNLYRARYILGQIGELPLLQEMAILHGKLEEHAEALDILVHRLQDHKAAEEHCILFSKSRSKIYRQKLFADLLRIYLNQNLSREKQGELLGPALHLLNSELSDFDAEKVIQMIPDHWSIAIIDQFLHRALRNVVHARRTCRIHQALAKVENVQVKFAKYDTQRQPVILTTERTCCLCRQPFTEPTFAWLPGNRIAHTHCTQDPKYREQHPASSRVT